MKYQQMFFTLTLYSVTYLHRSTFLEYSFFVGEILQRYKTSCKYFSGLRRFYSCIMSGTAVPGRERDLTPSTPV